MDTFDIFELDALEEESKLYGKSNNEDLYEVMDNQSSAGLIDQWYIKAQTFVKENHKFKKCLSAKQFNTLLAYEKCIHCGAYNDRATGKDAVLRKWKQLGEMKQEEAKIAYVDMLGTLANDWKCWKKPSQQSLSKKGHELDKRIESPDTPNVEKDVRVEDGVVFMAENSLVNMEDMEDEKLKSFWDILRNGIAVTQYDRHGRSAKQMLWLSADSQLVLVGERKSDELSTSACGIPMKDLSDVRTDSFVLRAINLMHDEERCVALVGTARTIDIKLETAAMREEIFNGFSAILKSICTSSIRLKKLKHQPGIATMEKVMSHVHWNEVRKGIPVYFCSKHGKKKCRNMKIKNKNGEYRLIVARKRDQMQRSSKKTSIALQDIGEIRPGLNSIAFKQNPDVFNQSLSCAIIGSEHTISIEFADSETKHTFMTQLMYMLEQVSTIMHPDIAQ